MSWLVGVSPLAREIRNLNVGSIYAIHNIFNGCVIPKWLRGK